MERFERYSSACGALLGGLFSGLIVYGFVDTALVWPAMLIGTFVGFTGGLWGQGHIEGIVAAGISLILLMTILWSKFPWVWVKETGTGVMVGNAVGWYLHGLFGVLPFFHHPTVVPPTSESSHQNEIG